jgi:hypothetical protein
MTSLGWLPPHQHHVLYSVAYADSLVARLSDALFPYIERGPFVLVERQSGVWSELVVQSIQPLPEAVPRLVSDALNQLRSAVEHALFAQLEHELGLALSEDDARFVEMPARLTSASFDSWINDKRRAFWKSAPETLSRVRRLQPFWHVIPNEHPLALLAGHTNHAKHRAPALAAARLGAVVLDSDAAKAKVPLTPEHRPVKSGDVLARVATGSGVAMSVWPTVSLQRPASDQWSVLMHEVNSLAEWVRLEALPILTAGKSDVDPIPPSLDVTVGYRTFSEAVAASLSTSSFDRNSDRLQAAVAIQTLEGILTGPPVSLESGIAIAWLSSLGDRDILERVDRLTEPAQLGDVAKVASIISELAEEAKAFRDRRAAEA